MTGKYGKYFVDVEHLKKIDIYRLVELFPIRDHALEHVVKKLLLGGVRTGGKTSYIEVVECRDTLNRWLEMREEDKQKLVQDVIDENRIHEQN